MHDEITYDMTSLGKVQLYNTERRYANKIILKQLNFFFLQLLDKLQWTETV